MSFLQALLEVVQITAPIFIVVGVGFAVRRIRLIDDRGVDLLNRIAYNVGLPALFLLNITEYSLGEIFNVDIIKVIYSAYGIYFLVLMALSFLLRKSFKTRGAFFVSSYRVNMAFIGLPIVWAAFGGLALARASLVIAFLVPVNIISTIIIFRIFSRGEERSGLGKVIRSIATDPIILAAVLGIILSYFKVDLPGFIHSSLDIISGMTVGVALLSIGASFWFGNIKDSPGLISYISLNKLVLMPVIAFITAQYIFRVDTFDRDVIVVLFATPLAVAAYVMSRELRSDHSLVSSALIITTILSAFTISAWLLVLRFL